MTFPVTVALQDRELVMTLAATALRQAAPEELVLLDETRACSPARWPR